MRPDLWKRIDDCLAEMLEFPAAQRAEFLRARLGDDPEAEAEARKLIGGAVEAERLFAISPVASFISAARPGIRLGPWELVHPLGNGGMSVVWKARRVDGQASMFAAIKLLSPALSGNLRGDVDFEQRFLVEKQILARLQHPNIARLLDAGVGGGEIPNFVMEYVEGRHLLDYAKDAKLDSATKLRLFLKVCDAVHYAHANLVIHRDLKPQNILVDAAGEPKLLDFGIGKILNDSAGGGSITLHRAFSLDYASPEQIRGADISTATDVYSLGLTLFELLTGEPARRWGNKPLGEVLDLAGRFALPSHPALAGDMLAILRKATAPEPALRYATVHSFAADVHAAMENRPVSARPAGTIYQLWCLARRNRLAVSLSTAALAAILILATWGFLSARQAESARVEAVQKSRQLESALTREQTARQLAEQQTALAQNMENLAKAREGDARRHLNEMLGILSDSIESVQKYVERLPGGTSAGVKVLERILLQLERLEPSAQDRPDYLAIRAHAHARLANLYAGGNNNLGQREPANVHREKSIALWGRAHQLAPGNIAWERAWLEAQFRHWEFSKPSYQDPAAMARWADYEKRILDLARRAPADPHAVALAGGFFLFRGFSRQGSGAVSDFQRGLEWFLKTLDETKPSPVALRNVALAHKYLSSVLPKSSLEEKAAHAEEALRLDRLRLAMDGDSPLTRMDVTFSISTVAESHFARGDYTKARAGYWEAYLLRKQLAEVDPDNMQIVTSLAYPIRRYGEISRTLRDLPALETAVQEFEWVAARPKAANTARHAEDAARLVFWKAELAAARGDVRASCEGYTKAGALNSALNPPPASPIFDPAYLAAKLDSCRAHFALH